MSINEVRNLVGQTVHIAWYDRKGGTCETDTTLYQATFLPMYGPCVITDHGEIPIDRLILCEPMAQAKAA